MIISGGTLIMQDFLTSRAGLIAVLGYLEGRDSGLVSWFSSTDET